MFPETAAGDKLYVYPGGGVPHDSHTMFGAIAEVPRFPFGSLIMDWPAQLQSKALAPANKKLCLFINVFTTLSNPFNESRE